MKSPINGKETPTDEQIADFLGGFSKKPEHPLARKMRELNEKLQKSDNS